MLVIDYGPRSAHVRGKRLSKQVCAGRPGIVQGGARHTVEVDEEDPDSDTGTVGWTVLLYAVSALLVTTHWKPRAVSSRWATKMDGDGQGSQRPRASPAGTCQLRMGASTHRAV